MNTEKIVSLVKAGRPVEALEHLEEAAKNTPYYNEVLVLMSGFNSVKDEYHSDRISFDDYHRKFNGFSQSILHYQGMLSKFLGAFTSRDESKLPAGIGNILFKAETFLIEEDSQYAFVALYLQLVNPTKETIYLQNFILDIYFDIGEKETLTWWRTDGDNYPEDLPLTSENKGQVLVPFKTKLIETILKPETPPIQGWIPFKGNPDMLSEDRGFKSKPIKLELTCIDAFHTKHKIIDDKLNFQMTLTQSGQILFLNYGY